MIELLRLLQGYVLFVAEGGFVERFLNLCKINDINLWNVKNNGVKVEAFTSKKDYERINMAAERSGMSVRIECERGFKTFVTRNKRRVGVAVGLFASFVLVLYLSGCIWNVEIEEKDGVKIEAFTNTLADLGVKTGARKSDIDILKVQDEMLKRHSELLWVSLNIFGGKAELEYTIVNEKTPSPETFLPTNIIASKKGEITLVECYRGTPVVKEGQNVAEGSILISGVLKNADNTETLTQAMGKVYAKTQNIITVKGEDSRAMKISGDVEPYYGFYLFGLDIPFGRLNSEELSSVTRISVQGNKTKLPVGFIRCDCISFAERNMVNDEGLAKLSMLLEGVEKKREQYALAELKNVVCESSEINGKLLVTIEITCVEDISVEKTISVEKN